MPEYRHGALHVIEQAQDKNDLQAALRRLDDRLFLERQVTLTGEVVWCVVVAVGGDRPPMTILEWRDADGQPLELSSGLLSRIERMERSGERLMAEVVKQNALKVEQQRRAAAAEWAEIGAEADHRMRPGYSAVLHRGQHLRRSRDARRNRGEKV